MNKQKIFKKAYNDYLSICGAINGEDFEESKNILYEFYGKQPMNEDDELYDVNFGVCCFTIRNEHGKAFVCEKSIEIWDDENCMCIGSDYDINEIIELGEIKD